MIDTEWFWLKKDPAAPFVETAGFDKNKFPYITDAESFAHVDDGVVFYEREKFSPCDILFEPTFLIGDRLQSLFKLLEPSIEFKGVQLYRRFKPAEAIHPLYWLPYLPFADAIGADSKIFQGKAIRLVVKNSALRGRRVAHCKLPADDIWLLSLEAAECLLRRRPIGILLEKVPRGCW